LTSDNQKIRTLKAVVVDDSVIYRKIIGDILKEIPGIELVGTASNGRDAIVLAKNRQPDIITLDVEMPLMNGLEALVELKNLFPAIRVIMISSLTKNGARITIEALQKGALDFVTKPEGRDSLDSRKQIESQLRNAIQSLQSDSKPAAAPAAVSQPPTLRSKRPEIIAIGISTGGPQALGTLISALPALVPVPIVIVQHMPAIFTKALAESLSKKSGRDVSEAVNGVTIQPNKIYLAPGGKQMRLQPAKTGAWPQIEITDDPPENFCKPSADYLFRSVAKIYGANAIGVIMTGMGNDGALGLRLMKRQNALVLAQDKASSVVYGMPGEAIKAGIVDEVIPLENMASRLISYLAPPKKK
jgi:two-component system, chemotaxis family, protein-glutamate methylesterase/glutaminase